MIRFLYKNMKKILLVISDDKTRQLYHEMFMSYSIEIVPVTELSTAIMLLSLDKFFLVILDVGENFLETEIFLKLRQKSPNLSRVKFILLTENKNFNPKIRKTDLIICSSKTSIGTIIAKIDNHCNF
jgi:DNA-binding NtrC family response regulator